MTNNAHEIAPLILNEMLDAARADGVHFDDEQTAFVVQALSDAAQEAINRAAALSQRTPHSQTLKPLDLEPIKAAIERLGMCPRTDALMLITEIQRHRFGAFPASRTPPPQTEEICKDCWYLQHGWHLGEAPREPDDLQDCARDSNPNVRCKKHQVSASRTHAPTPDLLKLLDEWDAEVRERGIWTSGHSIAARIVQALRASVSPVSPTPQCKDKQ